MSFRKQLIVGPGASVVVIALTAVTAIANALRFVSPGGDIAVAAAHTGDWVRFSVTDTGPGILDEDAAHVFDRHWQGSGAPPRSGLGLGLFICKGLVEAHGGRIGLDTRVGEGSTFWFELRGAPGAAS